jgi:hypothetical protein
MKLFTVIRKGSLQFPFTFPYSGIIVPLMPSCVFYGRLHHHTLKHLLNETILVHSEFHMVNDFI